MADLRLAGYDDHQHQEFSEKAIYATIKYGAFHADQIYEDQGRRWVKAQAVWLSKKRFSKNKPFHQFVAFVKTLPRVLYYTDPEGIIWLYSRPSN